MKHVKIFLAMAVLLITQSVYSQSYSQCGAGPDYNRVNIGWDCTWVKDGYSHSTYNGCRLDYLHGFCIADDSYGSGAYIATGVSLTYVGRNGWDDYGDYSENVVAFEIPVNLSYSSMLRGGGYIEPFTGPHVRLNAGEWTHDKYSGRNDSWFNYDGYKRCQFGWQFGVNMGYGPYNFCIVYKMDTPMYSLNEYKLKQRSLNISIGFNF